MTILKRKFLCILFIVAMSKLGYAQKTVKLIIDPEIKKKTLENISTTDFPTEYAFDSIYQTTYKVKRIVEDTIEFNLLDNEISKKSFSCNHYFLKDTLIIEGGFGGLYRMYGFVAKIFPNKQTEIKHYLAWSYPSYFNTSSQKQAKSVIKVDTKSSKIILNSLPKNKSDKKHIYGYVEFISKQYFIYVKNPKTKIPFRQTTISEYKIFFDSRYYNSEE
jgi:hypothetical protein